jgi:hypothetical protein
VRDSLLRLREAIAVAIALFVPGCGGATQADGPATSAAETACGDFFDENFGARCSGAMLPASELARVRTRYLAVCESTLNLPGTGVAASDLEACAHALKATGGCGGESNEPAECALPNTGSLSIGASCLDGAQCASGFCSITSTGCGTCMASQVPPAHYGLEGDACGRAQPIVALDAGGPPQELCAAGLTCNSITLDCAAPAPAGVACYNTSDCEPTLICRGGTCAAPGSAGQACEYEDDCGRNLSCIPTAQGLQCGSVEWASAGEPCDQTTPCLVGACDVDNLSGGGSNPAPVCPTVLADGAACTPEDLCDAFATCINGRCTLEDSEICP